MNRLKNGTIAVGAPGSAARKTAEMEDKMKGAFMAVDMIHADLFLRLQQMDRTETKAVVINEKELRALYLLASAALGELK